MQYEQILTTVLGFILTIMFILGTVYLVSATIKYILFKIKEKKSLVLLENGFQVVTSDKDGVPHIMKRGTYISTVKKIYKETIDKKSV